MLALKLLLIILELDPKTQSKRIKDNAHWGCIKMPVDTTRWSTKYDSVFH
jgi:hypothetical protein